MGLLPVFFTTKTLRLEETRRRNNQKHYEILRETSRPRDFVAIHLGHGQIIGLIFFTTKPHEEGTIKPNENLRETSWQFPRVDNC